MELSRENIEKQKAELTVKFDAVKAELAGYEKEEKNIQVKKNELSVEILRMQGEFRAFEKLLEKPKEDKIPMDADLPANPE